MVGWILPLAVLSVSIVLVVLAVRLGRTPGEKAVHLFEDERGNRANPFGDLSEGAANSTGTCRTCGRGLASDSYRYCSPCLESGAAD